MIHYYVIEFLMPVIVIVLALFVLWVIMKSLDTLNDTGEIEYFDEELSDEKV